MKTKVVLLSVVVLLAASAFAAEKTITLRNATQLNGTSLKPGDYKVSYDINGSSAEVKVLKGGETLTSAMGHIVELTGPANQDAVVNRSNSDGSRSIVEIQFAGKKDAIRFSGDQSEKGK